MEIVTYVLSGALEHRDSMGNGEILRPGEFQRMTAGTGMPNTASSIHRRMNRFICIRFGCCQSEKV